MLKVTTKPKAKGGIMSESTPEIPGQQTIDQAITEPTQDPTIPGVATADASEATSGDNAALTAPLGESAKSTETDPTILPAVTADSTSADGAGNVPDVSGDAPSAVPQVHRFRIVHEIANEGETVAHSIVTSAPLVLQDALTILADLARLGI